MQLFKYGIKTELISITISSTVDVSVKTVIYITEILIKIRN